jgi:ASCH domain
MSSSPVASITHALIIREPWISLLLSGKKIWELRSRSTTIRGRVGLIRSGSGLIVGTTELTECLAPLTRKEMYASIKRHQVPAEDIPAALKAGWTTPWVMRNTKPLKTPKRYEHPAGAVTWVRLDR